ncbi:MAG TPA: phage Gp37/Gp68 family protein [Gammaproteobacteria bacterium]|nr:phage Gp37/Gp68 family protein [Gammaproteobacteria bacterium]
MSTTKIEWTDRVWNPVRGCALVSPGCTNCYAMRQAHRFSGEGAAYAGLTRLTTHGPVWTGRARLVPGILAEPLRWGKPARVFVNSMSDLFHDDLTNEQIAAVFGVMAATPWHTYQVLTKRPERMRSWFGWAEKLTLGQIGGLADKLMGRPALQYGAKWPLHNVWLGVSVEDQQRAGERIPHLLATPAAVRFVSCEPLLGPVDLTHIGTFRGEPLSALEECVGHVERPKLDWVIVGGESGPGARPFDLAWARSIVEQCRDVGVPVFFKQTGTVLARSLGLADRKGGDITDPRFPADDFRVREFPGAKS